jgi:hypothetical protein
METVQDDYVLIDCEVESIDNNSTELLALVENIYDTNREFVMLFDVKDYLTSIWDSYDRNSIKVWKQFCLDFPRMDFVFDEEPIENPHHFFQKISKYWFKESTLFDNIRNYLLMIMLCNQSSFGLPCELLTGIYSDESNDQYVIYRHDRSTVKFTTIVDDVKCTIDTVFHIFNIISQKTLYRIPVSLSLDIQNIKKLSEKQMGIIFWKLLKE